MSIARKIARKLARTNYILDALEGSGKLPDCSTATMALAGNTLSGARRRMAKQANPTVEQSIRETVAGLEKALADVGVKSEPEG
jgi:hypothetical protein